MTGGLESHHAPLSLAGRLVRILGTVVEIPVLAVFHTGQDFAQRRPIAFQLIRDNHPRHVSQTLEQLAEKPLRRLLISPVLYEDIEDVAVLVDGAPQILPLPVQPRTSGWMPRAAISSSTSR